MKLVMISVDLILRALGRNYYFVYAVHKTHALLVLASHYQLHFTRYWLTSTLVLSSFKQMYFHYNIQTNLSIFVTVKKAQSTNNSKELPFPRPRGAESVQTMFGRNCRGSGEIRAPGRSFQIC